MRVTGFPPILGAAPRALILGSVPSRASLAAGQYYAHPRNAFWLIMGALFGAGPELPYRRRCARLIAGRVALWDVLAACRRRGSLDSAIERESEIPNDIEGLLASAPSIRLIALNGGGAAAAFARHQAAAVRALRPSIEILKLPSTSPAHAGRSYPEKLAAWRAALAIRV